jgi:hypothetical protein
VYRTFQESSPTSKTFESPVSHLTTLDASDSLKKMYGNGCLLKVKVENKATLAILGTLM